MVLKGPGARAGGWGETRAPSLIFPTHSVRGASLCLGGSLPLFIALPSRDLLLGKGRSLLSSTLPTLVVHDPPADTPPLMPYRRFANASPGPAELATP